MLSTALELADGLRDIADAIHFDIGSRLTSRKLKAIDGKNRARWINNTLEGSSEKVNVKGVYPKAPSIKPTGTFDLEGSLESRACELREGLPFVSHHAVVNNWRTAKTGKIDIRVCDSAQLQALRETAIDTRDMPPVLCAHAVLVSPSKQYVLLQRRSAHASTFKGAVHLIGGNYRSLPSDAPNGMSWDRGRLEYTMVREVFEASGIIVKRQTSEPVCIAKETESGSIQCVYLGVRIDRAQSKLGAGSDQGDLVPVRFDDLPKMLDATSALTTSARAHLLMWLAMGAPGAGWMPRFAGRKPEELFWRVVKKQMGAIQRKARHDASLLSDDVRQDQLLIDSIQHT